MRHLITETKNGKPVYIDLINSRAAPHVSKTPQLLRLLSEALGQTVVETKDASLEFDMRRDIGYDFTVATKVTDTIYYARVLGDEFYSRLVKNADPKMTACLSVVLTTDEAGDYEVTDTWIGRINPPQPDGTNDTQASLTFWAEHALVLENRPIQLASLTKTCPY